MRAARAALGRRQFVARAGADHVDPRRIGAGAGEHGLVGRGEILGEGHPVYLESHADHADAAHQATRRTEVLAVAGPADVTDGELVIGDVPSFRVDNMPYGGVKDSGLGRENGLEAIDQYTEIKSVLLNP